MGRVTADLIEELRSVAVDDGLPFAAIIVGFERKTEFIIWNGSADDALRELNEKVALGGEPLGLAAFDLAPAGGVVRMRPFAEYADEEWVGEFLNDLAATVKLLAERTLSGHDRRGT